MQLFRMRMAVKIKPEPVVVPDGVDNECVSFPLPYRVAVPGWIQILGMLSAIHKNLPIAVDVPLEQNEDVRRGLVRGRLNHPPRIGIHSRDASRQAVGLGIVLRLPGRHDLRRLGC